MKPYPCLHLLGLILAHSGLGAAHLDLKKTLELEQILV